jgi:hypothetical protein
MSTPEDNLSTLWTAHRPLEPDHHPDQLDLQLIEVASYLDGHDNDQPDAAPDATPDATPDSTMDRLLADSSRVRALVADMKSHGQPVAEPISGPLLKMLIATVRPAEPARRQRAVIGRIGRLITAVAAAIAIAAAGFIFGRVAAPATNQATADFAAVVTFDRTGKPDRRWPVNRSTLVFLLGLSVLFNIFFVVGAMTWRDVSADDESGEEQSINSVINALELDDRQADAFRSMRRQFRTESVVIGQQLIRVRDLIATELAAEQPDIERLRELRDQEVGLNAERQASGSSRFEQFIDLLTTAQRQALGSRLAGPHGRRMPPPEEMERRAIEKFDANGDGLLDEGERQAARQYSKQQHQQWRSRRQELSRKFDLDGDGNLSEEEREAFRQHLLETRGQRDGREGREKWKGRDRRNGDRQPPHDRPPPPPHGGQPSDRN